MSRLKTRLPWVHIPSFKEYRIAGSDLVKKYEGLGIEVRSVSDAWYYHTDPEGWARLLPHLVIRSSLYQPDKRDCDWYAKKASVMCCELYELNTLVETWGRMPLGDHAFCSFWTGEAVLLFEPNEAAGDGRGTRHDFWGYLDGDIVFGIGDNGYVPRIVFL